MQLIKVSEDFRSELKCDFIMVVDTEVLKSPELSRSDTNYKHNNELATLVIGISDITIINVPIENTREMEDIVQIVVHAFLRIMEVGKKPRCVWVHQSVQNMAPRDSYMQNRKKLAQMAAKMESTLNTRFSEAMNFDCDEDSYYIAGHTWHGHFSMAPVISCYSDTVYKLQRGLIYSIKTTDNIEGNKADVILKWIEILWNAVKSESYSLAFAYSEFLRITTMNKIREQQVDATESKVRELLIECRNQNKDVSEYELGKVFEKMWTEITAKLSGVSLPKADVYAHVVHQLRVSSWSKSEKFSEMLKEINLKQCSQGKFVSLYSTWPSKWRIQNICDEIVKKCENKVLYHLRNMRKNNTDYHDTYIRDILKIVEDHVKSVNELTDDMKARLIFYVCGDAARHFQAEHVQHERNGLQKSLERYKEGLQTEFVNSFNKKNGCQKKALEFIEMCVKPAVQAYVSRHLGSAIVEVMRTGAGGVYDTQTHFQVAILKQLLDEASFQHYMEYIKSFDTFVEGWMQQQVIEIMSVEHMTLLERNILTEIVKMMIDRITSNSKDMHINDFTQQFISWLRKQLIFPIYFLGICDNYKADQFAVFLSELLKEMELALSQGYKSKRDIAERIKHLPIKLHELLIASLHSCGKQCPFCGAHCEAEGQDHRDHFSNMHRPLAFFGFYHRDTGKLTVDTCTNMVSSDMRFQNEATKQWLPYKKYRQIYPDWYIKGDPRAEVSDYWKYVLMRLNEDLAKCWGARPADIPASWSSLTPEAAFKSLQRILKESYKPMSEKAATQTLNYQGRS